MSPIYILIFCIDIIFGSMKINTTTREYKKFIYCNNEIQTALKKQINELLNKLTTKSITDEVIKNFTYTVLPKIHNVDDYLAKHVEYIRQNLTNNFNEFLKAYKNFSFNKGILGIACDHIQTESQNLF